MTGVRCHGGLTQIARVLRHALAEAKTEPIKAAVFIGDACEEPQAVLLAEAGKLALFNLPFFVFHEGFDRQAGETFRAIARITGGAYAPFAPGSASELRALFGAVARYAAQGRQGPRRTRQHRRPRTAGATTHRDAPPCRHRRRGGVRLPLARLRRCEALAKVPATRRGRRGGAGHRAPAAHRHRSAALAGRAGRRGIAVSARTRRLGRWASDQQLPCATSCSPVAVHHPVRIPVRMPVHHPRTPRSRPANCA